LNPLASLGRNRASVGPGPGDARKHAAAKPTRDGRDRSSLLRDNLDLAERLSRRPGCSSLVGSRELLGRGPGLQSFPGRLELGLGRVEVPGLAHREPAGQVDGDIPEPDGRHPFVDEANPTDPLAISSTD
jgi:hypothetical protein